MSLRLGWRKAKRLFGLVWAIGAQNGKRNTENRIQESEWIIVWKFLAVQYRLLKSVRPMLCLLNSVFVLSTSAHMGLRFRFGQKQMVIDPLMLLEQWIVD